MILTFTSGCTGSPQASSPSSPESMSASARSGSSPSKASYSGTSFPMTVTDFVGHSETFETRPQRIAVVSGTPLNIFYDAGGTAIASSTVTENIRLVEDRAGEIKQLPQLGLPYQIDQEKLVAFNPDLVITQAHVQTALTSYLQGMGILTFTAAVSNLDDLTTAYQIFGALAGTSDRAESRIEQITADTQDVISRWPSDDSSSAAVLFLSEQAMSVKLDNSIIGQMMKLLGVSNIASGKVPDSSGSETANFDIEAIVQAQPDYILVTSRFTSNSEAKAKMTDQLAANDSWQAIDAVREGHIIYLPQQYFLYNAGPYYADSVRYLASSLRPDIYGPTEEHF